MNLITMSHNHASAFQTSLHLLIGLRNPKSARYSADGVFVVAQKTADGPIHTCVYIDGVRFTSTITEELLATRINFLNSAGWIFLDKSDMHPVCFGISHIHESDIFWSSEYKDDFKNLF